MDIQVVVPEPEGSSRVDEAMFGGNKCIISLTCNTHGRTFTSNND